MNYIEKVKQDLKNRIDVEDQLLDLYALLVFTRGVRVTFEDVHDAWAIWRTHTDRSHRSIIPFDELDGDVQDLDREYAEAIRETAKTINPRNINF